MSEIMNKKNKYITIAILFFSVILFFTSVYQMFVFDGKARGCSGDLFHKYRDVKSTSAILELSKIKCSSYRNCFTYWKYATYGSVIIFIGSGIYLGKRR